MYRPLPKELTIKPSDIEGLGLFAKEPLESETHLGISHYFIFDEIIRTPLGGFYNQSLVPNCYSIVADGHAELVTLTSIEPGEELTTAYTLCPIEAG